MKISLLGAVLVFLVTVATVGTYCWKALSLDDGSIRFRLAGPAGIGLEAELDKRTSDKD